MSQTRASASVLLLLLHLATLWLSQAAHKRKKKYFCAIQIVGPPHILVEQRGMKRKKKLKPLEETEKMHAAQSSDQ